MTNGIQQIVLLLMMNANITPIIILANIQVEPIVRALAQRHKKTNIADELSCQGVYFILKISKENSGSEITIELTNSLEEIDQLSRACEMVEQ